MVCYELTVVRRDVIGDTGSRKLAVQCKCCHRDQIDASFTTVIQTHKTPVVNLPLVNTMYISSFSIKQKILASLYIPSIKDIRKYISRFLLNRSRANACALYMYKGTYQHPKWIYRYVGFEIALIVYQTMKHICDGLVTFNFLFVN